MFKNNNTVVNQLFIFTIFFIFVLFLINIFIKEKEEVIIRKLDEPKEVPKSDGWFERR